MTGWLIAVEGPDGSGKSTQARLLADRLDAIYTREPGGTPLGERLRDMVLDLDGDHPVDRAEALMIAAARAQHVSEIVRPALDAGRHVVTDRYLESSIAYQGHGRGLGPEAVAAVSNFATGGLVADLVVLIDVDTPMAASRRKGNLDRIEQAGNNFHEQVVRAYRSMAAVEPDRWVVIDGIDTISEVADRVFAAVTERLGLG